MLTLLDVQHLDLPELFPRGERLFRRLAYDRAARRADRVIVISEWVRERVIDRLGLDPGRVHAIHLGVDHARFAPAPEVAREPFVLYPARPWPHKNHDRLLEAFALVRRSRPGAAARAHRRGTRPGATSTRRRDAWSSLGERAGVALPARRRARLPEPLRGVRAAARRGDGVRLPRRRIQRRLAARGGAETPPCCSTRYDAVAIAAGIEAALDRSSQLARLGVERAARVHVGRDRPRP